MSRFESLIVTAIVLTFVVIGALIYFDSQKETIELQKDEWDCAKTEPRTYLQPTFSGKTMIMIPTTIVDCVEYRRK